MKKLGIAFAALLAFCVAPLRAHHSMAADYNITQQVTVKGEITAVRWANPHVFITMAVRSREGEMQEWQIEGGAIWVVQAAGWEAETLQKMVKDHEIITVRGYRARKDFGAWAKEIEMKDGSMLSFN